MTDYSIALNSQTLALGRKTHVMGIVNVTPDSFSDGGRFFDAEAAVTHGLKLVEEGADILDIGGESTRPFSEPVSAEEESRRVIPVIEALAKSAAVPISIDTTKASVARRALNAGASIINDVSALRLDPELAEVAAGSAVPIILMHMLGTPRTMQKSPHYDDVVGEIKSFLAAAIQRAMQHGIARDRIIVDPGIGFGKTLEHNLLLLQNLKAFADLGATILIGPSRKAFIRNLLKGPDRDDLPADLPAVETGTQAAVSVAALNGAHIVRVHDVARTVSTLRIIDAIKAV